MKTSGRKELSRRSETMEIEIATGGISFLWHSLRRPTAYTCIDRVSPVCIYVSIVVNL